MKQRVLIFLLTMSLPSWATTYYVLAGGAGAHTAADWTNANCKIPDPLSPGDIVYIGNSGGNLADTTTACAGEASHKFTGSGTSGSHITIKAATGTDHGTATGWNSRYGVDVTPKITWSNSFVATDGLKSPFWDFCASYYDVNGEVGTADSSGTYGFYFKSAGRMFGFIRSESHQCSESSMSNLTFANVELDGVDSADAVVLGTGTVKTDMSNPTNVTWLSDASGSPHSHFDTSGYWNGLSIIINGTVCQTGSAINTVGSATSLTLKTACAGGLTGVNYTVEQSGPTGFDMGSSVSPTATVQNLSITSSYIHDMYGLMSSVGNVTRWTISKVWAYNNYSDAGQHSNAIDTQAPNGGIVGLNKLTVHNSIFKNIQGTAFIVDLTGTADSWVIYNNIFYYTSDWDSVCEHLGDVFATCGVSKWSGDNTTGSSMTNAVFYGNTLANIHLKPGHAGADNAGLVIQVSGSGANNAENNLWWNCTIGGLLYDGSNGKPNLAAHDYNTLLNTGYATTGMVLSAHDFQIGTAPGGVGINPFTNSFRNFTLTSETIDAHLNDAVPLSSPYNLDHSGATRGLDGTWERGAYELSAGNPPRPSTGLHVVGIQ